MERNKAFPYLGSIVIHLLAAFIGGQTIASPPQFGLEKRSISSDVELVAYAEVPQQQTEPEKEESSLLDQAIPRRETKKPRLKAISRVRRPNSSEPLLSETNVNHAVKSSDTLDTALVKASPDYLRNPPPLYPEAARRLRQEGLVILLVEVSENGSAQKSSIKQTSGHTILDDAALNAVKDWKFRPGSLGGIPFTSQVEVPLRFKLAR